MVAEQAVQVHPPVAPAVAPQTAHHTSLVLVPRRLLLPPEAGAVAALIARLTQRQTVPQAAPFGQYLLVATVAQATVVTDLLE
jgi:hypothetical protein